MIVNILACALFAFMAIWMTFIDRDASDDYEQGRLFGEALARIGLGVLVATGIAIGFWVRDPASNRRHAMITIGCTVLFILSIVAVGILAG